MRRWTTLTLTAAFIVTACSPSEDDTAQRSVISASSANLDWKQGSENTTVAFSRSQLVRCWPSTKGYDCIVAMEIASSKQAGSPDVRLYFRFQSHRLPSEQRQIERLSLKDGYRCEVTRRDNVVTLKETIWNDRRPVEMRTSDQIGIHMPWSTAEVGEALRKNGNQPHRSYLVCMALDQVVARDGLIAIDTPLVREKRLFMSEGDFREVPAALPPEPACLPPVRPSSPNRGRAWPCDSRAAIAPSTR